LKTVLSTKILNLNQKELLLNAGLHLVEYNAIQIEFLKFDVPKKIENAVFTSQNSVHAITGKDLQIENVFCVGQKTKRLLETFGEKIIKSSKNAAELANFIQKYHKNDVFYYFSGAIRRNEIADSFTKNSITFSEITTYKTILNPKKFDQNWDAILFYSPSGVESYTQINSLDSQLAICIGETTASETLKHTPRVHRANSPTVESVIAKAVNVLR